MFTKYFFIYLLVINIIGMLVNIIDKHKAIKNKWRIEESTLWIIAIIGGAPLSYITMKIIRHKTQHMQFMVGFAFLSIIEIGLIIYILMGG